MTIVRAIVAALLALLPAAAFAQSSITGIVRDTSGGVLPGVTIEATSPALIEGSKAAVTDANGLYRVVDLRPGPYVVTFSLQGFNTLKREGIQLPAEFTATVNAELSVGTLQETVTVTGEAPVVDIRSSGTQMQVERDTLEALPGTGRLALLNTLLPGANLTNSTERSAGGNDRTQTRFSLHGAPEAQPYVDGINQQIPGITIGVFVFSQLNIQEVTATSGGDAEADFGGTMLKMVPRDGGNQFSGLSQFSYSGPALEASNINDDLIARHLDPKRVGSLKKYRESGLALGGPIKQSKVWFYVSAREGVNQLFVDGVQWNKLQQPLSYLYEPDPSKRVFTNDYTRDLTGRLTWQVSQKDKIVLASSHQPNCNCLFNILTTGTRLTPEAAGEHHYNPNYTASLSWTRPVTNRLLIEGGEGTQANNQDDTRITEWNNPNFYRITDQALNLTYGNVATRTLPRRQHQGRFAVSYVTGSHQFKTGVTFRHTTIGNVDKLGNDPDMHGTAVDYRFSNGVPNLVTLLDAPWNFQETTKDLALFAQDQWTINRVTVNAGARYNHATGETPLQVLGAGKYVPERRFEPLKNIPNYQNISPRVGVAYDVFGNGKTALKASLGRYPDIIRTASGNPASNLTRTTTRTWNDANRNYVPDCDLRNPVSNGECGPWSNLTFGQLVGSRYADGVLSGWNREYANWQGSVALQHELRPGFGVSVGYFRTWYVGDAGGSGIPNAETTLTVTDNLKVAPSDFDQYCITAPTDSRLPNSGQQLCGLFDVRPSLFGQTDNVIKSAEEFGRRKTRVFNGVDLTTNARFGSGGQLSGGVSIGRMAVDNCVVVDSPQDGRPGFCRTKRPWGAATDVKFLIVYPLPYDIQTSAIYQNSAGIPITANYVVTNAQIASSLGRNLSDCAVGAATCNANRTIALIPDNSMFEPRAQQLDLRFARTFRFGGTRRFRPSLDIYNLFNAATVLAMNTTYGQSWKDVTQILNGRQLRVGAQFDF
ncbi:MAG TPA: carboxypeptidase regulatory-like domain-containing protein [Vicinamibacterales bacterium]|nr:carboxypeptidase regulatory-like domain-containing protein [Vicinamibacterales bacterium]